MIQLKQYHCVKIHKKHTTVSFQQQTDITTEEFLECTILFLHQKEQKAKWKLHLIGLQGFAFHVQVPDLHCQVIPGHQITSAVAELDIRNGGDDFRKEGPVAWVLRLFKDWMKGSRENYFAAFSTLSMQPDKMDNFSETGFLPTTQICHQCNKRYHHFSADLSMLCELPYASSAAYQYDK